MMEIGNQMTRRDIWAVMQEVSNRLQINGGCPMLSLPKCECSKCQIDRMDLKDIQKTIRKKFKK